MDGNLNSTFIQKDYYFSTMIDYYAVLNLSPSASFEQIRSAYRQLAFRYHPDVAMEPVDIAHMQLLNEAYAILGSPVKRAQYDFWRRYTEQPTSYRPTRSEPRSSGMAESSTSRTGQSASQTQDGNHVAAYDQIDWLRRIFLFVGELIYHVIIRGLVVFLYMIPATVYFILLGRLSVWISPELANTNQYYMVELFAGSIILTHLTVRLFRKRIVLRDFLQRFRF
jgi:curved DNA-binding protein CbpA